jgi:ribonuclease P protein component
MLARPNRLTKDTDFKKIAKSARPIHSAHFILKKITCSDKESKFGIVVSAKVSKKSTVRNKIRRRLQEILRINLNKIKKGFKVMIVVKTSAVNKDYQEIRRDLELLLKNSGLI